MTIAALSSELIPVLKEYKIIRASLFGSFARGDQQENSDVNLLIDTNGKLNLFDILRLERKLAERVSRKVDLVEFDAIKSSIREQVLKETIQIL